jgi:hypothetical protein
VDDSLVNGRDDIAGVTDDHADDQAFAVDVDRPRPDETTR